MGHPELVSTPIGRPLRAHRSRPAPHQHGPTPRDGPHSRHEDTLVSLALALQDGCERCVEHHAAEAARLRVSRLELLEALGTALLLSTSHAERWPRLADAALTAHGRMRS